MTSRSPAGTDDVARSLIANRELAAANARREAAAFQEALAREQDRAQQLLAELERSRAACNRLENELGGARADLATAREQLDAMQAALQAMSRRKSIRLVDAAAGAFQSARDSLRGPSDDPAGSNR